MKNIKKNIETHDCWVNYSSLCRYQYLYTPVYRDIDVPISPYIINTKGRVIDPTVMTNRDFSFNIMFCCEESCRLYQNCEIL